MKLDDLERRPEPGRPVGSVRFRPEWIEQYGEPPADLKEREKWLVAAIKGDPAPSVKMRATPQAVRDAERLLAKLEGREPANDYEVRSVAGSASTARATADKPGTTTIHGRGLPWAGGPENRADLGFFVEEFLPTAFDDQRRQGWPHVSMRVQHDRANPLVLLGTTKSGSMRIEHRADGLYYRTELPETGPGPYVMELIRRGDLGGSSIGFIELEAEWALTEDERPLRRVHEAWLGEISVVTTGAYPAATVNLRHMPALTPREMLAHHQNRQRELEAKARELGSPNARDLRQRHDHMGRRWGATRRGNR